MPTLHVEVTLTVDDLVKAAQRLNDEDFERFMVAIEWVASRRKAHQAAPRPQDLPSDGGAPGNAPTD